MRRERVELAGDPVVEAGAEARRSGRPSAARSTAATVPCMPGMPRCCGWLSGNAPRAISVVTTGAPEQLGEHLQLGAPRAALSTPPPT